MKDLHDDKTPEGISRYENIEELLNGIRDFTETEPDFPTGETSNIRTLDMYLQDISLLTDADKDDKNDTDKVSLMTMHAAKGLEFPHVYIVGMEENLFPSIQSLNSRADLEEERRLFYVAITRAEKAATLSYAENRYRWGNLSICEPSRFIEEIDEKYIDAPRKTFNHPSDFSKFRFDDNKPVSKTTYKKDGLKKIGDSRNKQTKDTPQFDASPTDDIRAGVQVEHQRFGKGKVLNVEGNGPSRKATVFFPAVGQKQLLLKYARLRVVG